MNADERLPLVVMLFWVQLVVCNLRRKTFQCRLLILVCYTDAVVVPGSPDALAMGENCLDHHWDFHWVNGVPCFVTDKGGSKCPIGRSRRTVQNPGYIANVVPAKNASHLSIPPLAADHFLIHFPKHLNCPVCQKCQIQRSPHRKKENVGKDHIPVHDEPKEFEDLTTADHKVIPNKVFTSFDEDCVSLVVQDRTTYFFGMYPADSKDGVRTAQRFNLFIVPEEKAKSIYIYIYI